MVPAAPADTCVSRQLQPEQLDCGAAHLQHPLAIVNPVTATPVFTYSGLTAVAVASVNNYTVVFLGTASGGLLKASEARQPQPGEAGLGAGPGRAAAGGGLSSGLCREHRILSGLSEHPLAFGNEEVIGCCRNVNSDACRLATGGR